MTVGTLVQIDSRLGWSPLGLVLEVRLPKLGDRTADGYIPNRTQTCAVVSWADGNRSVEHVSDMEVIHGSR